MKATGIIRRIDELGRIVLPKELRSTYKIKEGTPLEIFIGDEGELILKKYSLIGEMGVLADECVEALFESLGETIVITDKEKVISIKGELKKVLHNSNITNELAVLIENRKVLTKNKKNMEKIEKLFENNVESEICGYAFVPIIVNGDTIGSVLCLCNNDHKTIEESYLISLKTVAFILSKQII